MDPDDDPARTDVGIDPADEHAERANDLGQLAAANEEAIWGETDRNRIRVPGLITGDIGPKGKIAAQLRSLGRSERATYGQVPFGTTSGMGRLLIATMLGIVLVLVAVIALFVWLAS